MRGGTGGTVACSRQGGTRRAVAGTCLECFGVLLYCRGVSVETCERGVGAFVTRAATKLEKKYFLRKISGK